MTLRLRQQLDGSATTRPVARTFYFLDHTRTPRGQAERKPSHTRAARQRVRQPGAKASIAALPADISRRFLNYSALGSFGAVSADVSHAPFECSEASSGSGCLWHAPSPRFDVAFACLVAFVCVCACVVYHACADRGVATARGGTRRPRPRFGDWQVWPVCAQLGQIQSIGTYLPTLARLDTMGAVPPYPADDDTMLWAAV